MSGMSARKGMAISLPRKSASVFRFGSRETIHSTPQVEMLSSLSDWPRLYRLAATLLGIATKSALPPSASTRSWSGSFHRANSTLSATSFSAPVSTMWISGTETAAAGPASTSLGSLSARAGVASARAARQAAARRPRREVFGLKKAEITRCFPFV